MLPMTWPIFPWILTVSAALMGVLLGRYLWSVAHCYERLFHASDTTATTAEGFHTDAPPDARLLGRALRCALHRPFAHTAADCTRAWLAWMPAALLATAYALLAVHAGTPASALGLAWAVTLLMLLALIDARTCLLPDALTLPLLWTGLTWALMDLGHVSVHAALTATIIAYAALWLLAWLFLRLRGRDGMGGGDVKLLAAIGAWVGWPDVFLALLCASVTGLVYALAVARGRHLGGQHPFGPHLAGAAAVLLLLRTMGMGG